MNYCSLSPLKKKFHGNFSQNTNIFIPEISFEYVIWKNVALPLLRLHIFLHSVTFKPISPGLIWQEPCKPDLQEHFLDWNIWILTEVLLHVNCYSVVPCWWEAIIGLVDDWDDCRILTRGQPVAFPSDNLYCLQLCQGGQLDDLSVVWQFSINMWSITQELLMLSQMCAVKDTSMVLAKISVTPVQSISNVVTAVLC